MPYPYDDDPGDPRRRRIAGLLGDTGTATAGPPTHYGRARIDSLLTKVPGRTPADSTAAPASTAPAPQPPKHSLGDYLQDIARQAPLSLAEPIYRVEIGGAHALGMDQLSDFFRRERDKARDVVGPPQTPVGVATNLAGQTIGEIAQFVLPGKGLELLAEAPRIVEAARAGNRFAKLLRTAGAPTTLKGRLLRNALTGSPIDAVQAAAGKEDSNVGGLAQVTGNKTLGRIAENPAARVGTDVGLGLALGTLSEEVPKLALPLIGATIGSASDREHPLRGAAIGAGVGYGAGRFLHRAPTAPVPEVEPPLGRDVTPQQRLLQPGETLPEREVGVFEVGSDGVARPRMRQRQLPPAGSEPPHLVTPEGNRVILQGGETLTPEEADAYYNRVHNYYEGTVDPAREGNRRFNRGANVARQQPLALPPASTEGAFVVGPEGQRVRLQPGQALSPDEAARIDVVNPREQGSRFFRRNGAAASAPAAEPEATLGFGPGAKARAPNRMPVTIVEAATPAEAALFPGERVWRVRDSLGGVQPRPESMLTLERGVEAPAANGAEPMAEAAAPSAEPAPAEPEATPAPNGTRPEPAAPEEAAAPAEPQEDLSSLSDDEVIDRYRKYSRGLQRTRADVDALPPRERVVENFHGDQKVVSNLSERGMKALGRQAQAARRVASMESELRRRGIDPATLHAHEGVKPGDVYPENRDLVRELPDLTPAQLDEEREAAEELLTQNPNDKESLERWQIVDAERRKRGLREGSVHPAVLAALTRTGVGAVVGAAVDDQHPVRGALLGAAAAELSGRAAMAIAQHLGLTDEAARRATEALTDEAPIRLTGRELGEENLPTKDLRARARKFTAAHLRGKSFRNADTGWDIAVNKRGLDKTFFHSAKREHLQSIAGLPDLLERGKLVKTEANRNAAEAASVPLVHTFVAPVEIDGTLYGARMIVKEAKDGRRFYDHDLTKLRPVSPSEPVPFPAPKPGGTATEATDLPDNVTPEAGEIKSGRFPKRAIAGAAARAAVGAAGGATVDREHPVEGAVVGAIMTAAGPAAVRAIVRGEARPGAALIPDAPKWFSRLTRAAEAAPFEKGTAEQWKAAISKGVAKAEREWTGIDAFLDDAAHAGRPITKDDVANYLDRSQIRLKETTLGHPTAEHARAQADYEAAHTAASESRSAFWEAAADEDVPVHTTAQIAYAIGDTDPRAYDDPSFAAQHGITSRQWEAIKPALVRAKQADLRLADAFHARDALADPTPPPRYERYTEPGGSNYREVLLQLDRPGPDQATIAGAQQEAHDAQARYRAARVARNDGDASITDEMLRQLNNETALAHARLQRLQSGEAGAFRSSHFNEPDIVAHIRLKDRTDSQGRKWLHIEELQSDWQQAGRKRGFHSEATKAAEEQRALFPAAADAVRRNDLLGFDSVREALNAIGSDADWRSRWEVPDEADAAAIERWREAMKRAGRLGGSVPDMPYRKTEDWLTLALKRVVDEAARGDYYGISWSPGEVHTNRYDLRHQVQHIDWERSASWSVDDPHYTIAVVGRNGREVLRERNVTPDRLSEVIGKEPAERIADAGAAGGRTAGRLSGDGLAVGGEGMISFYDKIVPNTLKKMLKQHGLKLDVEEADVFPGSAHGGFEPTDAGQITESHLRSVLDTVDPENPAYDAIHGILSLHATGTPLDQAADQVLREIASEHGDGITTARYVAEQLGGRYREGRAAGFEPLNGTVLSRDHLESVIRNFEEDDPVGDAIQHMLDLNSEIALPIPEAVDRVLNEVAQDIDPTAADMVAHELGGRYRTAEEGAGPVPTRTRPAFEGEPISPEGAEQHLRAVRGTDPVFDTIGRALELHQMEGVQWREAINRALREASQQHGERVARRAARMFGGDLTQEAAPALRYQWHPVGGPYTETRLRQYIAGSRATGDPVHQMRADVGDDILERQAQSGRPLDEVINEKLNEIADQAGVASAEDVADWLNGRLDEAAPERGPTRPGFAIPDELRAKVKSEGQSLFSNPFLDPSQIGAALKTPLGQAAVGAAGGAATDEDHPVEGAIRGAGIALGIGAAARAGGRFLRRGAEAATEAAAREGTGRFSDRAAATATRNEPVRPITDDDLDRILKRETKAGATAPPPNGNGNAPPPASTGDVEPSDYVNLAKFALDESGEERLKEEVTRVVQREGLAPKQKISWEQTKKVANSLGLKDIDVSPEAKLSGPEMLAIRNIVSANIEAVEKQSERLKELTNPEEIATVQRTIGALEAQNAQLLGKFTRERSRTGRDLNNMKILANRTLDPFTWFAKAQRLLGDRPLTDEVRVKIRSLINAGDREGLIKYVAGLRQATAVEKGAAIWKAGLLTGPPTHLANILGNTAMAALEAAKDAPALVFDRMIGAATGLVTKDPNIRAYWEASKRGARQGARQFARDLGLDRASAATKEGKGIRAAGKEVTNAIRTPDVDLTKFDIGHHVSFQNAFLDTYVNTPFKLLSASDKVFKSLAIERSLTEQARLMARQEGFRGAALTKRAAELAKKPSDEMALRAIHDAEVATFQNNGLLARVASAASRELRRGGAAAEAAGELVLPFKRTPANVATRIAEYSPFGYLATMPDIVKLFGEVAKGAPSLARQRKIVETLGRASIGTAPIAAGYLLAKAGRMTGGRPDDPHTLHAWDLEGKQENAILLNGKWHSVERVSPLGNLMVFGAQLYDVAHDQQKTASEKIGAAAGAIPKSVMEQTFLTGVQQLLDAVKDPNRAAGSYLRNTAASLVPNIVARAAYGLDPDVRQAKTVGEAIQRRIPFASRSLPARLNNLGEPTKRDQDLASALFDPTAPRTDRTANDPVIKELSRVGAAIGGRRKDDGESEAAYRRRLAAEGRLIRQALTQAIASDEYQQIPEVVRAAARAKGKEQYADELALKLQREVLEQVVSRLRAQISRARATAQ